MGAKSQVGLIDRNGQFVVEPIYRSITDFSDGCAIVSDSNKIYKVIDEKGKVLFENEGRIEKFSNGAAVFRRKVGNSELSGYIDPSGKIMIEAKYKLAYEFSKDQKALVNLEDGKYAIVDKTGNVLSMLNYGNVRDFSEGMLIYYDKSVSKSGYINESGNIVLGAKYNSVSKYKDGFGVINITGGMIGGKAGVVNLKGEVVFEPSYSEILNLGKGLFAIRKKGTDQFEIPVLQPMAIFNQEGRQMTDFTHYSVGEYAGDLACASDDSSTYFIDTNGNLVPNLPKVKGIGTLKLQGNLIKAQIDDDLYYLTRDGKMVWKPDRAYKLAGGITVQEQKFRPNRFTLVLYPYVEGLKEKGIQDTVNEQLKKLFIENKPALGEGKTVNGTYIKDTFRIEQNKDLLIVRKDGYDYPYGAAHGMPVRDHYYVNQKSGRFYSLKDLFKRDSYYLPKINAIISRQMDEKSKQKDSMFFYDSFKGISDNQHFILTKDALKIYFYPYAVAAYAAGFPEFDIPYAELMNIIDTGGEFWNSFEKSTGNAVVTNPESELKDMMDTVIRIYEQSMVSAINTNMFSYVEPFLLKGSNLYNSQKALVGSLYSQGIKEKYVSSRVEKVEVDSQKNEYKLYVKEEIAIKYQGKDYETKPFYYIYTVNSSEDRQCYLLSDIHRWER